MNTKFRRQCFPKSMLLRGPSELCLGPTSLLYSALPLFSHIKFVYFREVYQIKIPLWSKGRAKRSPHCNTKSLKSQKGHAYFLARKTSKIIFFRSFSQLDVAEDFLQVLMARTFLAVNFSHFAFKSEISSSRCCEWGKFVHAISLWN